MAEDPCTAACGVKTNKQVAGEMLREIRRVLRQALAADPKFVQALYDAKVYFNPDKFQNVDLVVMKGENRIGFLGLINTMVQSFTDERLAVLVPGSHPDNVLDFAVVDVEGMVVE